MRVLKIKFEILEMEFKKIKFGILTMEFKKLNLEIWKFWKWNFKN